MKSFWVFVRRYWYSLLFMLIAVMAVIAGTRGSLAYDQRTYLTVLGGILIMLAFKMIDYIDAGINRKKAKEEQMKGATKRDSTD